MFALAVLMDVIENGALYHFVEFNHFGDEICGKFSKFGFSHKNTASLMAIKKEKVKY